MSTVANGILDSISSEQ